VPLPFSSMSLARLSLITPVTAPTSSAAPPTAKAMVASTGKLSSAGGPSPSGPVLVVVCPGVRTVPGAEAVEVDCDGTGHISPQAIIAALAARGLGRMLIEGGAETLARFLNAGAVDELHLMLAPIVLGSGKTGLNLTPITDLDQAMRPRVRTMRFKDGDMLCMCDIRLTDAA